jgi:predicted Holliday junction resolvase-like endonuclease
METSTIVAFIIAVIALVLYYFKNKELAVQKIKENSFKKELEEIKKELVDSYRAVPELANQQFEKFRENELNSMRSVFAEASKKSALADLEKWKGEYENFYRQDAINRSQSTILGKVTEHLIPFHKNFPYNPKEARFIGSPIDIIVFKGLEEEERVEIHILEIKTGKSQLSKRQRLIRDAIDGNRVFWRVLNL